MKKLTCNEVRDVKLRSSCPEVFHKKAVLRNFAKFTGKYLCQRLFFNTVAGQARPATLIKKSLWHRCFPVNFAKFLRTPFLQKSSSGCFCKLQVKKLFHTYSVMHFAFVFSEYNIFSEYITITSSKEALKV